MNRTTKRIVSLMIALFLVIGLMPQVALPAQAETVADYTGLGLDGLYISILGDSISTMQNVSDGTGAASVNTTLPSSTYPVHYENGSVKKDVTASWYYRQDGARQNVKQADTWWQQTADQTGMKVLVNNSWSGSLLLADSDSATGYAAYKDRVVQVHANTGDLAGTDPDIIAFFLGTNDYLRNQPLGTYAESAAKTLWTLEGETYTYATPATTMDAYLISLHKISIRYPNAEVYCFTLLPAKTTQQPTAFNAEIAQMVENTENTYLVDLYNCGFQTEAAAHLLMSSDGVHPNKAGMDAVTKAFISSLLANSKYTADARAAGMASVSVNVNGMLAKYGYPAQVVKGSALEFPLVSVDMTATNQTVTVTMGGVEVPDGYGNGKVSIANVTGDVVITASASSETSDKHDHTSHKGWIAWDGSAAALADGGRFYLADDVTVSEEIVLDTNCELVLCLNGKTLTSNGARLFGIYASTKVSVCDCTATGTGDSYTAGKILVDGATAKGAVAYLHVARANTAGQFNLYDGILDGNGGNNAAAQGGGLIDTAGNVVNIYGGRLQNYTGYQGGAVRVTYQDYAGKLNISGDVVISNCDSSANGSGGAICLLANGAANGTVGAQAVINGTVFKDCDATDNNGRGGAINSQGATSGDAAVNAKASLTITNATFENCTAKRYGGAIFANNSVTTISGSTFTGCKAEGSSSDKAGGAIFTNNYGSLSITGSDFINCSTTGKGGAIHNYLAKLTITDTDFTNCTANDLSGAVYVHQAEATLNNVTTTGCAAANGDALVIRAGSAVTVNGGNMAGQDTYIYDAASALTVTGDAVMGNVNAEALIENADGSKTYYLSLSSVSASGKTVLLQKDASVEAVSLSNNTTLDLNGKMLTATVGLNVTNGSHVVDSSEGQGRLVADNLALDSSNAQLAVKTENGYVFTNVQFYVKALQTLGTDRYKLRFLVSPNAAVSALLANSSETENYGVTVKLRLNWTENGEAKSKDLVYTPQMVSQLYTAHSAEAMSNQFYAIITGADQIPDLTITPVIEGAAGTVNPCGYFWQMMPEGMEGGVEEDGDDFVDGDY